MPHPQAKVHCMFELVEPIATVTFSEVPNEAFLALGMRNYWDGYFAGRAAPLGLAPAAVVHAVFYNFADGEVARHIPWVWGKTCWVRIRGQARELGVCSVPAQRRCSEDERIQVSRRAA